MVGPGQESLWGVDAEGRVGWTSSAELDAPWNHKVIPVPEAGPGQAGQFHGQKGMFFPSL